MGRDDVDIEVTIGGREYSAGELAAVEIARSYFTLHELHRLGAVMQDRSGVGLSDRGIDAVPRSRVRSVLLDNKLRLGRRQINRMYRGQYREADDMWHRLVVASDGDYGRKVARTHLVVTGLTAGKCARLAVSATARLGTLLTAMEPDHLDVGATHVTEVMGMYGRPTQMRGRLGVESPIPLAADHPVRLVGASSLVSDPSLVNAVAVHQMEWIPGGVDILAAACFPSAAPQELVDGHAVHMAIEFSNLFRVGLRM